MALTAKLQLRQSQSLVMTPQLMQSIKLLQFTQTELEQFIDQEIERNPLIERADARDDEGEAAKPEPAVTGESDWLQPDLEWNSTEIADKLDTSLGNIFPDDPGTSDPLSPDLGGQWRSAGAGTGGGAAAEGLDIDQYTAAPVTLSDHLREQIALAFREPGDLLIAGELAGWLDESGYLTGETADIAARLGTDEAKVARVLAACQQLDPPGVFARDLSECLALQLKTRDRFDPAMAAMVANLELLARRDFASLKGICGVDEEDLLDMLAEIRALDPKPGLAFQTGMADAIVPDVIVRSAADGTWQVELNSDALPRVLMNQAYAARISAQAKTPSDREFISECVQNASWLTRSLDQRAKTILKVAVEIVRQQDAFLLHGVEHLRPLNLRTVADAIAMHESTVSRVTANKYMLTPRGVFEMRYFFTAAIQSAEGGDAHSAESVRHRIRQLIDGERAENVLSDDAIVDQLRQAGIEVARRTVAKYREGMSIPSSVQRRREKKALARAAG
ncbi:MAG: RNA polymerase factor sigma-54 [Notoacmeibacter sp.]|nr:RNA polymerase factor sigma-54 [Notoacmeibacter sp.]